MRVMYTSRRVSVWIQQTMACICPLLTCVCTQACIHTDKHACIYTCMRNACVSLHVPAQATLQQSADGAACGRVPGPHVAFVSVRGLLLHATWAHACVARVMAEHTATISCVPRTDGQRAETHTRTPQHSLVYVRMS
jgi:hypothetical protein